MIAVRKLLTPWKALIATVVICATAPPAKADLYLTITDESAGGQKTTLDVNKLPSGKDTFDGYTFTYSVSSTSSKTSDSISLTMAITSSATAGAADVKFTLFSSTATSLGSLPSAPTTGAYSPIGTTGTGLLLTSSLTTTQMNSNFGSLTSDGTYTGFGSKPQVGGIQGETTSSLVATGSSTLSSTVPFSQAAGTQSFNLSETSVQVSSKGAGTSAQFTETTTVALPEPSGVAAAMAGLPCLGLLVGFVRRRRVVLNQASAA